MSGVGFKRFARVAFFFACAGGLQFCLLNPQPEPPGGGSTRTAGGTGGSSGTTGSGGAGGIIVADSGSPPIDPGKPDARTTDTVGGLDASADAPAGDALPPDDDAPSLDADLDPDAPGADAPSLDADVTGEDADAPGEDAPGADGDDAQGDRDDRDTPDGGSPDATD